MTLDDNAYDWSFKPAAGYSFTESGSASCHGTAADTDGDLVATASDNCPAAFNPDQANADGNFVSNAPSTSPTTPPGSTRDGAGDTCDTDDDNDGLADTARGSRVQRLRRVCDPLLATATAIASSTAPSARSGHEPASAGIDARRSPRAGTTGDPDGDRLLDRAEVCYYNSNPSDVEHGRRRLLGRQGGGFVERRHRRELQRPAVPRARDLRVLAGAVRSS